MMSLRQLAALPLLAALFLVLAAPTGPASVGGEQPASATAAAKTPKRTVLRLRDTPFGKVIHEKSTGLAAYLFTKERSRRPRCNGACAKGWPPIKTKGAPKAGKGLAQRHLGTVRRRGGARMVTYKGHPLYFYSHDSPGEILCDDVVEFGGTWFVVNRNGKPA
jgi:predicted lipoprotein with Yx(FWY)xxD motif